MGHHAPSLRKSIITQIFRCITDYVILDQYSSIDEAVKSVIAEGLEVEEHTKQVNKKWEEWSKETD